MRFPALLRSWLVRVLVVYFNVKFSCARRRFDLRLDFNLLYLAHHINNALIDVLQFGVRQRPLIGFLHVFKNQFLPLRFIDWHAGVAFEFANLLRQFGPLVQQLHQAKIKCVNLFAPVGYVHKIPLSLMECESRIAAQGYSYRGEFAALLPPFRSEPINSATACGARPGFCSIVCTIALPITAASANSPTWRNCSGVEMPKPTATGSFVCLRMRCTSSRASLASCFCAPVMPVHDTAYTNTWL